MSAGCFIVFVLIQLKNRNTVVYYCLPPSLNSGVYIFPVSMVLQSRQNMKQNMKKSMHLGPAVSEQNFIPEYIFILSSAQLF
jgi:hypothetical protein